MQELLLVIPFFGDQHVSAELVEKAGLGFSFKHERPDLAIDTICKIHDKRIDNGTSFLELLEKTYNHFTGSHFTGSHFTGSKNSLNNQNHQSISISDIELPGNVVNFRSGDLLYGVNIARMRFQTSTKGLFDVGDMRPPSTRLPRLPALIDHYNDVLRLEDSSPVRAKELKENDSSTEYGSRLHALENYYRNKHFPSVSNHAYPPTNLEGLWHACCGGLAYFLLERRDTFIHFVIHPEYDSNINKATTLELRWIREHYAEVYDRVRFYWFLPTNDGSLEACNPLALNWFEWRLDEIQKYLDNRNIAEADIITDHLPTLKQGRGTIYVEKRLKTANSLYEKIKIRGKREGIIDGIGIRFIHLWTNQLSLIADQLVSYVKHHVHLKCISERGRVIHLVFYPTSGSNVFKPIEVQLWPIALHTCFESEHDTIYKARIAPTQEQLAESRILRQKEHELQSLIDAEASSLSCWR
jgi:ppGpp synthetase/RelA/SpoT-type nucleotidyltranferase